MENVNCNLPEWLHPELRQEIETVQSDDLEIFDFFCSDRFFILDDRHAEFVFNFFQQTPHISELEFSRPIKPGSASDIMTNFFATTSQIKKLSLSQNEEQDGNLACLARAEELQREKNSSSSFVWLRLIGLDFTNGTNKRNLQILLECKKNLRYLALEGCTFGPDMTFLKKSLAFQTGIYGNLRELSIREIDDGGSIQRLHKLLKGSWLSDKDCKLKKIEIYCGASDRSQTLKNCISTVLKQSNMSLQDVRYYGSIQCGTIGFSYLLRNKLIARVKQSLEKQVQEQQAGMMGIWAHELSTLGTANGRSGLTPIYLTLQHLAPKLLSAAGH